jgi:N-methylhydantoinase A
VKLNAARAHEGFDHKVARPLGMPLVEAAHGAHLIAASNMMRAIRAVSSERGRDPREYALFAFGGNGPLFAAGMAEQLEMRRIVVPPAPGLFSSFGLLYADVEHHYVRTWRKLVLEADPAGLGDLLRRMEAGAREQLAGEGFSADHMRLRRSADCRYQGQSFELTVPMADGPSDARTLAALAETFGQEHERTYGHRAGAEEPVEIVSLRLVAQGISDRPRVPNTIRIDRVGGGDRPTRRAYFGPSLGWRETPILDRPDLATPREGPCVIEEYDATCVVPPGARAMLDDYGNIVIELGRASGRARSGVSEDA